MWRLRDSISSLRGSSANLLQPHRHRRGGIRDGKLYPPDKLEWIANKIKPSLPLMARQMINDGLLSILCLDLTGKQYSNAIRKYISACETPEQRHEIVVSSNLLTTRVRLFDSFCDTCLYQKQRCICRYIEKAKQKHDLWLFQHVGEYGRNNNTGSLLCLVANATRTIRGLHQEENAMLEYIENKKDSTVILFPNEDAVTVDEYHQQRLKETGRDSRKDPLTLVLLDGTSRQAKNLDRFMPDYIPRIRIGKPRVKSWLDPIRRQTEDHRVCTAQGM